jgi:2-amino-4-hydroxy-6-hydroxymethyldihydropteridine diphosphokinase
VVTPVVLSLGTNEGDRSGNMRAMVARAGCLLDGPVTFSRLMKTVALDVSAGGPWFLNRLACGGCVLSPRELLKQCQDVERELGRTRARRGGSRTADIDIVLFGDTVVDEPDLRIPHPAIAARRFLLEGLATLAPSAAVPGIGCTCGQLRERMSAQVRAQGIEFLAETQPQEVR